MDGTSNLHFPLRPPHPLRDNRALFPLRRVYVKCVFIFYNTSNKSIKAVVGFPGNEQDTAMNFSLPITDFTTVIDNKRYPVIVKKEIIKEYKEENIQKFRNWYTWEMTFSATSKVKVLNTYLHYLSAPSGYDPFYLNYELSTGAN